MNLERMEDSTQRKALAEEVEQLRTKGNNYFKEKNYEQAVEYYSRAIVNY